MSQTTTVGRVATQIGTQVNSEGTWTFVRYHSTDVVKWNERGKIILNHGGYMTVTTKTRMNQASNQFSLGFQVYQKDYDWYVAVDGHVIDFDHNPLVIRNGRD